MISSYRIHQEQILRVAENLNAPFQKKNSRIAVISEKPKKAPKRPVPAPHSLPVVQVLPPAAMVRCSKCNAGIPAMDYLYTQQSGLCISCWEEMEA